MEEVSKFKSWLTIGYAYIFSDKFMVAEAMLIGLVISNYMFSAGIHIPVYIVGFILLMVIKDVKNTVEGNREAVLYEMSKQPYGI